MLFRSVTVADLPGCGWHIYSAFSPEGDGTNDTWVIDGIEDYKRNRVVLFNRWEDVVNEFEDYDNEKVVWNGTNKKGVELPEATYFYIIVVGDKQYSGWVQITR